MASFTLGTVISAPDSAGSSDTATFTPWSTASLGQATDPVPISDALITALDAQRSALDSVGISDPLVPGRQRLHGHLRPAGHDREFGNLLVLLYGERLYVHRPNWGVIGATHEDPGRPVRVGEHDPGLRLHPARSLGAEAPCG